MAEIRQLLDQLAALGFEGTQLEQDVWKNIQMNLPGFSVSHQIPYGAEIMFYELLFGKDDKGSYELQGLNATHRGEITIRHITHNGIDTASLEERMATINWKAFFEGQLLTEELAPVHELLNTLSQLGAGRDPDALGVQRELMLQYWPKGSVPWQGEKVQSIYEHKHEYRHPAMVSAPGMSLPMVSELSLKPPGEPPPDIAEQTAPGQKAKKKFRKKGPRH
ncbi:hypothetical protein DCC81_25160 [Chitinophaga parva]|uniref:Uncharacterized protein n=1 Tax=Chitinophaga parva TaxID=2169414 RepID=A0A2T7BB69_9BACT|nr:hypothetical protein [Chitinophaga parva]PUZ21300.1 hypothetical protein DCC81_25160 [Chitinophaga parva]